MGVTNYYWAGDMLLGESGPNGKVDYLTDALGSVTTTVNGTGAVLNEYRYKPSGALLSKAGTAPDPKFTWVGSKGYRQTELAYCDAYVRARHCSSLVSSWTSSDPLWPRQRCYSVSGANPTTYTDPTGLLINKCCCWAIWMSANVTKSWITGSGDDQEAHQTITLGILFAFSPPSGKGINQLCGATVYELAAPTVNYGSGHNPPPGCYYNIANYNNLVQAFPSFGSDQLKTQWACAQSGNTVAKVSFDKDPATCPRKFAFCILCVRLVVTSGCDSTSSSITFCTDVLWTNPPSVAPPAATSAVADGLCTSAPYCP
jgi:hypothetical protein